jgi:hypothetical protein
MSIRRAKKNFKTQRTFGDGSRIKKVRIVKNFYFINNKFRLGFVAIE